MGSSSNALNKTAPVLSTRALSTIVRDRYAELVVAGTIDDDPRQLVALEQLDAVVDGLKHRQENGLRSRADAAVPAAAGTAAGTAQAGGDGTGDAIVATGSAAAGSADAMVASGGPVYKGAYIYGGVGVGKSFLM